MGNETMYTSYAKDVFIDLMKIDRMQLLTPDKVMSIAIQLIKQARDAFS